MDKTVKLYENDSYIKSFEAVVSACTPDGDSFRIVVDKTAFFPEGGGQGADRGRLGGVEVLDVQEKDGIVYHRTDGPLAVGSCITGTIDWALRFSNMQQHSGEHIVSGLVHKKFGYSNVGFHLGSQAVTLDFNGPLKKDEIDEIEAEANSVVFDNRKISVSYPSKAELAALDYRSKIEIDGQVRLVTIEACDICACCAPHVSRTGEIGLIKMINSQKYKGGVRLTMLCGFRALADFKAKQASVSQISVMLSAKPESVADAVKRLQEEHGACRARAAALQEQLLLQKAEALPEDAMHVCLFEHDLDSIAMRRAVNAMTRKRQGFCGLFVGDDAGGYRYIIGSAAEDTRRAGEMLKARFDCRGGGSREMIQGQLNGSKADIEALWKTIE